MPDQSVHAGRQLSRHAPAGRRIPWRALMHAGAAHEVPFGADAEVRFFTSATAALAVAVHSVLDSLPDASKQVALPAYACPNLLAATLWAGGTPEFEDLDAATLAPRESESLQMLRTGGVVVGVDAFGSPALSAASLAALPEEVRARLVHDLAQSFEPLQPVWRPRARFTVMSFGRAKPVSLTLGGALIASRAQTPPQARAPAAVQPVNGLKLLLRALLYNLSLSPLAFGLLSKVPQLGIGRTEFEPLRVADEVASGFAGYAFPAMRIAARDIERKLRDTREMIELAVAAGAHVPERVLATGSRLPLWRVPVLCPSPAAAEVLARDAAHLGVSRLYGRTLPEFDGVTEAEAQRRWPVAWRVSRTLVTLPAHGRLDAGERRQLAALLAAACAARAAFPGTAGA